MMVVNKKLDVGINARSVLGQIKNLYKLIIKIIYYIFWMNNLWWYGTDPWGFVKEGLAIINSYIKILKQY